MEIRRSYDRLISTMGLPILSGKTTSSYWIRALLMSPGPQNVTLRYIYTFASPLKFTHDLPPTYTAMSKQCTWGRLVSIEWQLTELTPCVSSYYTETNILHFKNYIFVHHHHLEIIRTRHTNVRVTQYQWHIEGTTLSDWTAWSRLQ